MTSLEVIDTVNIVVLYTAYQIDDLIMYLNTNYPTCTPVFFEGQSLNSILTQLQRCNINIDISIDKI